MQESEFNLLFKQYYGYKFTNGVLMEKKQHEFQLYWILNIHVNDDDSIKLNPSKVHRSMVALSKYRNKTCHYVYQWHIIYFHLKATSNYCKKKQISKTILQSTIESCKKNFQKKAIGMLSQWIMHKLWRQMQATFSKFYMAC